ncbi:hypothetical protein [Mangrovimonas cancribranchiae]|uniref:Uncharacterized protein n=1 Tax=Mangrovimonas cancribranchiae TaxID=3080055 RepID=A0AAU6P479_9FLAO
METNTYSHKGFKFGILGIGLILIIVILSLLLNVLKYNFISILIGLTVFAIGIVSIIGFIKSLKGIKEPNTFKKIIGIIINFGLVTLFLLILIANGYDIYKALIM